MLEATYLINFVLVIWKQNLLLSDFTAYSLVFSPFPLFSFLPVYSGFQSLVVENVACQQKKLSKQLLNKNSMNICNIELLRICSEIQENKKKKK